MFTVLVRDGTDGYVTAGVAGSVSAPGSRSRRGSVPRLLVVESRLRLTESPWLLPNTPVKSDMPGRWNAIAKPPRMTLSPSCEPKISLPIPRSCDGGCQARPTLGARLLRSGL